MQCKSRRITFTDKYALINGCSFSKMTSMTKEISITGAIFTEQISSPSKFSLPFFWLPPPMCKNRTSFSPVNLFVEYIKENSEG